MPHPQTKALSAVDRDRLIDIVPEPGIRLGMNGSILHWNRSAAALYGRSQSPVDAAIGDFIPVDEIEHWKRIWTRIIENGSVEPEEMVHRATSGDRLDVRVSGLAERTPDGEPRAVYLFVKDLTQIRRNERLIKELERQSFQRLVVLAAASRVALDILANRAGVDALKHIVEAARTLTNARYAALAVRHTDGLRVSEFVTAGLSPEEVEAIGTPPVGRGILGLLLHRFEPLRIDCLKDHPASIGFPPHHPPMMSFLGVPIRRGEMVLGSLYLTNKIDGAAFTEADEVAVEALGAHAAVAIYNLQMLSRQRALLKGLINVQEEERRAVAYDLHDGLTQYVMASYMHMEAFRSAAQAGKTAKAERDLRNGMQYLKEATVESRRLVNGLRSLALDDLGLAGAIEQLFNEEKAYAGWSDAEIVHNLALERFDKSLETAAYRVVQEALNNVRKHAQADKVRLLLLLSPADSRGMRYLSIEVRDWGRGFAPEDKSADTAHVGLQGMSERVSLAGGSFSIATAPGDGVTLRAKIPVT